MYASDMVYTPTDWAPVNYSGVLALQDANLQASGKDRYNQMPELLWIPGGYSTRLQIPGIAFYDMIGTCVQLSLAPTMF
uniref:EBS1 n=1 Tax=Arundo donax TaxID=35708 RepID=A0A0A9DDF2_ARUDO